MSRDFQMYVVVVLSLVFACSATSLMILMRYVVMK